MDWLLAVLFALVSILGNADSQMVASVEPSDRAFMTESVGMAQWPDNHTTLRTYNVPTDSVLMAYCGSEEFVGTWINHLMDSDSYLSITYPNYADGGVVSIQYQNNQYWYYEPDVCAVIIAQGEF